MENEEDKTEATPDVVQEEVEIQGAEVPDPVDQPPEGENPQVTWRDRVGVVGLGAGAGLGTVVGGFAVVGLSPVGPVAGGWFALNMGAGLVAGGGMATLQSLAMTTSTYVYATAVGGMIGGILPESTVATAKQYVFNTVNRAEEMLGFNTLCEKLLKPKI